MKENSTNSIKKDSNIDIKIADSEDLYDLTLCAKEFLEFIDNFKNQFLNKHFFILTAYSEHILCGALIAEDKTDKVDSLKKIVPTVRIRLVFVNPLFKHKGIGKQLLDAFIQNQKEKEVATIYVKLPLRYKKGIDFYLRSNFQQVQQEKGNIILELKLWKDYGISECQNIGENIDDLQI